MRPGKAYQLIPLASIRPACLRDPQEDAAALDRLAATVRGHGVLSPLRVRPDGEGGFRCDVGGRRLAAAALAGLAEVPCVVRDADATEEDVLGEQLIEQLCREDLPPMAVSRAYRRMLELHPDWSQRQLAEHVGVDVSTVCRALQRLDLEPAVQERIDAGEVPPSTAIELHGLPAEEQVAVAGRIAAAGESRAEVREKRKPAPERAAFKFESDRGWKIVVTAPRKRATEAQAREALRAFLAEGEEAAQAA